MATCRGPSIATCTCPWHSTGAQNRGEYFRKRGFFVAKLPVTKHSKGRSAKRKDAAFVCHQDRLPKMSASRLSRAAKLSVVFNRNCTIGAQTKKPDKCVQPGIIAVRENVSSACSFMHLRYWRFSGRKPSVHPCAAERWSTLASSIQKDAAIIN